jgi:hypothetical protein
MISWIVPARGRVEMTRATMESIHGLASCQENVESIWRWDNDDPELESLKNLASEMCDKGYNVRYKVGGRLNGYASLHTMVNECCSLAKGDYIGTFGNDARILTKDWDLLYKEFDPNKHAVIQIKKNGKNGMATQFPVMTRRFYESMGGYSRHASIDDYPTFVAIMARCHYYCDVEVDHDHYEGDYIYTDRVGTDKKIQNDFWGEGNQMMIVSDVKNMCAEIGLDELKKFYNWK